MSERTLIAKEPTKRPVRPNMGARNRLSVANQDPNYKYRVVAVDGGARLGRIEQMREMGYEVAPGVQIGDNRVDIGKGIGKTGIVSLGQGTTGVLMRIPKEDYEYYKQEKHEYIDKISADLKHKLDT